MKGKKRSGVVDATKLPIGKPTGITSATLFNSAGLENGVDVSPSLTSSDPPRGTKAPSRGPGRPR